MSLWEDGRNLFLPSSPFTQPQTDPGTDPTASPTVCVQFNQQWLPYVVGALTALCQPATWGMTGSDDPTGLLGRVTELVNIFGLAGRCPVHQEGHVPLVIPNGEASAGLHIDFDPPFSAPPIALVASNDGRLHPWFSDLTAFGMTVSLDAAVPVIADTDGVIDWSAELD